MVGRAVSTARDEILDRIRAALAGDGPARPPVPRGYRTADDPGTDALALLEDRLVDYRATVRRCAGTGLAGAIGAALAATRALAVPPGLPAEWLSAYHGEILRDDRDAPLTLAALDAAGVSVLTGCAVAIAMTGTIILDGGPGQGRRALTLVPDHHVCVVRADQASVTVPAALARLADRSRPITLISGPSATSDIELNRIEGVHGPRRLDVILFG